MDEEIFGEGGNTYPKARYCPNGRQHTDELPWDCGLCAHPYIDQDEVA
jgi:hypothetical protein